MSLPANTSAAPSATRAQAQTPRKEIRELTLEEQKRLVSSLTKMQTDTSTQYWFKIAGLHGGGLPNTPDVRVRRFNAFCAHRRETFPAWHRAYLFEFEAILQLCDPLKDQVAAGKVQPLMLPYWDWNSNTRVGASVPDLFLKPQLLSYENKLVANPLKTGPITPELLTSLRMKPTGTTWREADTQEEVLRRLNFMNVRPEVIEALAEPDHRLFASTGQSDLPRKPGAGNPTSIEEPHDDIHVAIAGAMASVNLAAFDFIFWAHHCNIDRMYYFWQTLHPNSKPSQYVLDHASDYYALEPFYPRSARKGFPWENSAGPFSTIMEWYDYKTLPYTYSSFPPPPVPKSLSLRTRKTYAVLPFLPQPPRTIQIYIFIAKDAGALPAALPTAASHANLVRELDEDPHCAGAISIFSFTQTQPLVASGAAAGGDDMDTTVHDHAARPEEQNEQDGQEEGERGQHAVCLACLDRQAGSRFLDVTDFVKELRVKKAALLHVRALAVDYLGAPYPLTLASGEPCVPRLVPESDFLFAQSVGNDAEASDWDLARVDHYLTAYGFKAAGDSREDALRKFQAFSNLSVSGRLDAATVSLMSRNRAGNRDLNEPSISLIVDLIAKGKTEFKYYVTNLDYELQQNDAAAYRAIQKSFDAWTTLLNDKPHFKSAGKTLSFTRAHAPGGHDVEIAFAPIDGKLKTLGFTSVSQRGFVSIVLDSDEDWVVGKNARLPKQSVKRVLTHEIGHLFGLAHQSAVGSIMNPFLEASGHVAKPTDADVSSVLSLL